MTRLAKAAAFALITTIWLSGVQAMAADGLVTMKSAFGPEETMKRLFTVTTYDQMTQKLVTREWVRVKTGK